ncbi:MAG: FtsX-like permease family protein [Spirochaetes bacterium]|nr:FtsX-like permease family protein [Spirochaetota bacterium]
MVLPGIALRNLSRQKRRNFLLAGALAFGVMVIVAVNGLVGGLLSSIQRNASDLITGHIFFTSMYKDVNGRLVQSVDDDSRMIAAVSELGLDHVFMTRRTGAGGSIVFNGESAMRQLAGVDWNEESYLAKSLQFDAGSADGMAGSDGIIVSTTLAEMLGLVPKSKLDAVERDGLRRELAAKLKAGSGTGKADRKLLQRRLKAAIAAAEEARKGVRDEAIAKSAGETLIVQLSTIHGQQNVGEFRIRGIYRAQFDFSAYVDRTTLNRLVDMPDRAYNLLGVYLKDPSDLDAKTVRLHQALVKAGYDMYPIEKVMGRGSGDIASELQRTDFKGSKYLVTNINNELGAFIRIADGVRAASGGLFAIIMAVIMVGIVNTFRVVVYERTREIGTMRALGARRSQVRNLFLLEALFLSLGGTLVGFAAGFLILAGVHLMEFNAFTELAFFLERGRLAWRVEPGLLAGSLAVVCAMTLAAASMPAGKAARLRPANALRAQF